MKDKTVHFVAETKDERTNPVDPRVPYIAPHCRDCPYCGRRNTLCIVYPKQESELIFLTCSACGCLEGLKKA